MRLAPLTTLRLGGPAQRLVEASSEDELVEAVRSGPALVLAGGSNVVIADEGVPGHGRARAHARRRARRRAAGRAGRRAVGRASSRAASRTGCRASSACPASPARPARRRSRTSAPTGRTSRRRSRGCASTTARPAASRRWTPRPAASTTAAASSSTATAGPCSRSRSGCARPPLSGPLRYAELARVLDVPVGGRAPLADVRAAVLALRRGKGMVIDPDDPDSVSAGSFFTNPILTPRSGPRFPARRPPFRSPTGGSRPRPRG